MQAPARLPAGASWASYYRLRGLPLASPAALLLDAVLLLHEAAARLDQLAQQQGLLLQPLVLHLLGPQRELDQWPLLLELGCLLPPQQHVSLHLIGPDVPSTWHGRSLRVAGASAATCGAPGCTCTRQHAAAGEGQQSEEQQQEQPGSLELHFWQGEWHDLAAVLERPHALVAPNAGAPAGSARLPLRMHNAWHAGHNRASAALKCCLLSSFSLPAGLAAYLSWVPTLQRLLRDMRGRPGGGGGATAGACLGVCCFTDYNEEAIFRGQQLLEHLLSGGPVAPGSCGARDSGGTSGGGGGSGIEVSACMHPFRKPAAVLASDHALPSSSNSFALWLTAG